MLIASQRISGNPSKRELSAKIDAFAEALVRMIEDDELRHRCGPAAAETGRSFKMEAIGPMWDELFRELQEERAAALSAVA